MSARRVAGRSAEQAAPSPRVEKLNGTDIQASLIENHGLTGLEAHAVWETVLETIRDALIDGRSVVLKNVGTMEPCVHAPRRFQIPGGDSVRSRTVRVGFSTSTNLRNELRRKATRMAR